MTALIITIIAVVLISALCSLTEACLYSLSWTFIEKLNNSGSKAGQILFDLRSDIKRPIAAVLILNTIANTAGASVAGAIAGHVLGDAGMGIFAALMTLLILSFGEILPKTIGVTYSEPIAKCIARPLRILTLLLTPLIWLSSLLTRIVGKTESEPAATAEDILALTRLSRRSGQINANEETAIGNILSFDDKRVTDVMTPRTMIFSLPASITAAEAYALPQIWNYSRIPVYGDDNEDIVGIVLRRRIVKEIAENQNNKRLDELMQPVHFILENQQLDILLKEFLNSHMHLFVVLDEYGGLSGVVSLEDVLEELLGQEIVDESDAYTDMREAARKRRKQVSFKIPSK